MTICDITAQGGDLLIQQYHKNSIDLERYKKWNFELFVAINRFNTKDRASKGRINWETGLVIYYMIKKSFGVRSGLELLNYSYQYDLINDTSFNKIKYVSLPVVIRIFPSNKFAIDFGFYYNNFLNGSNAQNKNEWIKYEEGVFFNSFGFVSSFQYAIWKKFSVELKYRYQKNSKKLYQRETNNFSGFALGINYPLFKKSSKRQ